MQTRTAILETLEDRRLFSVAIGSLTAETIVTPASTPNTVFRHAKARFSALGVTASPDDRAVAVTYFFDVNRDGALDRGDKLIGTSRRFEKNFAVERHIKAGEEFASFPLSAVARGTLGKTDTSPVATQTVTVADAPPTIKKMKSRPRRVEAGKTLMVSAHTVEARDGQITGVAVFMDVNHDGNIDAGDINIGAGARRSRSRAWRIDAAQATVGETPGSQVTFLAQAVDAAGVVSSPVATPAVTVLIV